MLQLLKPTCIEPMLHKKRSPTRRSPHTKRKNSPWLPRIPETWEGLWSQNYFHNNETLYFPFWLTLSHKSTNPYSGISPWLLYATWYCDRLKAEANWESNYHLLSQTLKDLQKSLLVMPFSSQKMLEVWKLVTFHKKLHECVLVFKNKLVLNFFLF